MSPDGSGSPSSVVTMPIMSLVALRRDDDDPQLLGRSPNDSGVSAARALHARCQIGRHRQAVDLAAA